MMHCRVTGERYLRQMLADALQIANCATNPEDREAIKKAVSDIQSMTDALAELRAQGKVGRRVAPNNDGFVCVRLCTGLACCCSTFVFIFVLL